MEGLLDRAVEDYPFLKTAQQVRNDLLYICTQNIYFLNLGVLELMGVRTVIVMRCNRLSHLY